MSTVYRMIQDKEVADYSYFRYRSGSRVALCRSYQLSRNCAKSLAWNMKRRPKRKPKK